MRTERQCAFIGLLVVAMAACGDHDPAGTPMTELTVTPAAGTPGSRIELRGLPAIAGGANHWVTIGGQRTALLRISGDTGVAVVPAFVEGQSVWPSVPQGPVDIEVHGPSGRIAAGRQAFTVLALQRADGTTEVLADDLASIVHSLESIASMLPPESGEAARFAFVIGRTLDSLSLADDFSVSAGLAELKAATPEVLPLLDALLAASGVHLASHDVAKRLDGVATSLAAVGAQKRLGGTGGPALMAPNEQLTDETLSMLMQLAVYLKQNTAFQSDLSKQVSGIFGLLSIMGVDLNAVWNNVPVQRILNALTAITATQALLLNTYLVAALPSRLDSLTVELASDTLTTGQRTVAQIEVHASNRPDPVTLGELLARLQAAAGVVAQTDQFEKLVRFIIQKTGELLQSYANENPQVAYDSDIVDLWSMPELTFKAPVHERRLLDLISLAPDVVEPIPDDVNWVARADTSARTTIRVQPSVGPASIPVLVEWLAEGVFIFAESNLVLGSFGEDIKSSDPVDVWVAGPKVEVTVNPPGVTLKSGQTRQFTATVTGTANTAVTWTLVGPGTLSSTGHYQAPLIAPGENEVATVIAKSVADPSALEGAIVYISEPNCYPTDDTPCGGAGSSWGDPHLITPDGQQYDFMAVGDFVLAKSTNSTDGFEVQTRYRRPDAAEEYSWNQAVAMRVESDIVNVYAGSSGQTELMINGQNVTVDGQLDRQLGDGATLLVRNDTVIVSWPDGTMVRVVPAFWENNVLATVGVFLPTSRSGKVEGLLGNFDGNPVNDIRIRGGDILEDPRSDQLYLDFRQSWRIASGSSQSLFFRNFENWDPFFPPNVVGLDDLDPAAVAHAETVCRAAGVVNLRVFEACTFDVALTGDDEWALIAAGVDPARSSVTVVPGLAYLTGGASQQFSAIVTGPGSRQLVWTATSGSIRVDAENLITYTAPAQDGAHTITATLAADASVSDQAAVYVTAINAPPGYTAIWTGARSTDWGHGGNWVTGAPPGPTDNVFIPAQAVHQPLLAHNDSTLQNWALTIHDLLVEQGARLALGGTVQQNDAYYLTAAGNVDAAGEVIGEGFSMSGSGKTVLGSLSHLTIEGTIALAGPTVLSGSLRGLTGSLDLSGQTLTVNGEAFFSSTLLLMSQPGDRLIVGGKLTFTSSAERSGMMTAGEIHLAGDFEASQSSNSNTTASFAPTGTRVVLNGAAEQKVIFKTRSLNGALASHFDELEITNPTVIRFEPLHLNHHGAPVRGDLKVTSTATLAGAAITVHGDLRTVPGSDVTLALVRLGGALGTTGVEGDFSPNIVQFIGQDQPIKPELAYSNIEITAPVRLVGPTLVAGYVKLWWDNGLSGPLDFNGQTLTVEGDFLSTGGSGSPRMVDPADLLIVKGQMDLQGGDSNGQLSEGEIHVAGNFSAAGGGPVFVPTGTKVVLNGTAKQTVALTASFTGATRSYFHDLEITNATGVDIVRVTSSGSDGRVAVKGSLDLKGMMTVLTGAVLDITETLYLRSTSVLANEGTMNVSTCEKENGHTISGTDPCP